MLQAQTQGSMEQQVSKQYGLLLMHQQCEGEMYADQPTHFVYMQLLGSNKSNFATLWSLYLLMLPLSELHLMARYSGHFCLTYKTFKTA